MQEEDDWEFGVGDNIPSGSTPDSDPPQSFEQLYCRDPWQIRPDSSDQVFFRDPAMTHEIGTAERRAGEAAELAVLVCPRVLRRMIVPNA
eukprot:4063101-Pyramimonas_sp.AAC.1